MEIRYWLKNVIKQYL